MYIGLGRGPGMRIVCYFRCGAERKLTLNHNDQAVDILHNDGLCDGAS